jgi:hypothetical protein
VTQTYSASRAAATGLGVEDTIFVLAGAAEVITFNLNVKVKLFGSCGAVLEDGEPFALVQADTKVDGSPVTDRLSAIAPLATFLRGNAFRVDVILGRSCLALPLVVGFAVGAGQGLEVIATKADGNGLGFRALERLR